LLRKQDTAYEMERVQDDIEKLRKEKEYLIQKQQQFNKEHDERTKKIDYLNADVIKYDKVLKRKNGELANAEHEVYVCK
jgi:chromosome segregation ATPase